jgi:hypothetical protein
MCITFKSQTYETLQNVPLSRKGTINMFNWSHSVLVHADYRVIFETIGHILNKTVRDMNTDFMTVTDNLLLYHYEVSAFLT